MEWAWKPMAAVMNDNKTDMVYWVPPLYASNILTSLTASSSSASSPGSSLCSSPSVSRARSLRRSTLGDNSSLSGSRKKRLSRRRVNMSPKQSIDEEAEPEPSSEAERPEGVISALPADDGSRRFSRFEGTVKKDLIVEFEADDIDIIQSIQSNVSDSYEEVHGKETIKLSDKRRKSKCESDKTSTQGKAKTTPSFLKLLEKMSHISDKPKNRPFARKNPKIERTMSAGSQKVKRPSLKVYQNVPKHGSGRRATAPAIATQPPETAAKEARMVFTGRNNSGPRLSIRRASRQASNRSRSASVTTTGLKMSQVTEAELRSAHLEMMIKILATLYEEKISRQDFEIKNLKDKFKTQDKIVKQIVHSMLELKSDVKKIREHLLQQEEIFHHRSQQLIAQQSIPEEIEEVEDMEMFEIQDSETSNIVQSKLDSIKDSDDAKLASEEDSIMTDGPSVKSFTALPLYERAPLVDEVTLASVNAELNLSEIQVLEPPHEFQGDGLEGCMMNISREEFVRDCSDQEKALSSQTDLEAQDGNEFNIYYLKLEQEVGSAAQFEHFIASQYICDYHPKQELKMGQLQSKLYGHSGVNDEGGRCSGINRQRSDDSTDI